MKKLLLTSAVALACLMPASANAASLKKVAFGTVSSVNVDNKTFSVKGDDGQNYTFQVNPKTEMEIKRDFWFDTDADLDELENGWWVKVKYYQMNPTHFIADEVDIHK